MIHLKRRYANYHDHEATLEIKFPHPLDGYILLEIEAEQKGSFLKMPYFAPENGYSASIVKNKYVDQKNPVLQTNISDKNCYFLRVRSETDQGGKLIKANYVKIHNDFRYDVISSKKESAILLFRYYYNPIANDRNLEFDMNKNLFKNLHWEEVPLSP